MNDAPATETKMQRIQRRQAERIAQLESEKSGFSVHHQMPASELLKILNNPQKAAAAAAFGWDVDEARRECEKGLTCDIPPPVLVKQLYSARLSAPSGPDQKIAASLLATLLLPFAEYLKSLILTHEGHKRLELEFWVSCLRAGTFPHLVYPHPKNEFMSWVFATCPYVTETGEIPNWKTL